jgi:hypothetical protein
VVQLLINNDLKCSDTFQFDLELDDVVNTLTLVADRKSLVTKNITKFILPGWSSFEARDENPFDNKKQGLVDSFSLYNLNNTAFIGKDENDDSMGGNVNRFWRVETIDDPNADEKN